MIQEEIIISGRNLPNIDPSLEVWHLPISIYLFLGGLAAGILFFASLFTILNQEKKASTVMKEGVLFAFLSIVIGLVALLYDLTNPSNVLQLYATIRWESPMSWGAWVLLLISLLTSVWLVSYFNDFFPKWKKTDGWLSKLVRFLVHRRKLMAMILLPLSIILGVYTGILLSAFNARPLWNNAILGPLFLVSGLSTGAATIILLSKSHKERSLFTKIDLGLILMELALIIHFLMGLQAGTATQIAAWELLTSDLYLIPFFGLVIFMGLFVPGILKGAELSGLKIPVILPVLLVLIGGLLFRIIMVEAGQMSQFNI